jgi:RNA polymerase-binding transcription factor DksA
MYNLNELNREVDYAGNKIVRTGFLVCDTCDDELQPQKLPQPAAAER